MSYIATTSGFPCWYELSSQDLDGACAFYGAVLGWQVDSAGMPGFDYRIASSADGFGVAGLSAAEKGVPSAWTFYLEVANCDATVVQAIEAGGSALVPPTDIPRTGRFAICRDPQGAIFAVLQPEPMDGEAPAVGAHDPKRVGHGAWHELMTSDPAAAFDFYSALVGWTKGAAIPMGDEGDYQLFAAGGTDIGGMHSMGDPGAPAWLSYFKVASVEAAVAAITEAGGTLFHGPAEVPGGDYVAIAADPQGATFGVLGSLN